MRPIFAAPIAMLGLELISETQRMQAHDGSPYGFARRHVGAAQPPPQADMFQCPGVDVDAFAEDCRAVIFPDMWNAWRLLKSTADGVTASSPEYETDAANEARALLTKLQGEGTIRHVEVKVGGPANPWGTPVIQDRNSVCAHPMVLRASKYQPPYLEVYVRFVYRGPDIEIPWPVRKVDWGMGSNCPIGADWMLDAVYGPDQRNVPPPDTDSPFPPTVDPDNTLDKTKLPGVPSLPQIEVGLAVLLAFAAIGVIGYTARAIR